MPDAHIEISAEDGAIDAFVSYPEGVGPWRPIILLSDSWGLRPVMEDIARALAGQGFFALAPRLPSGEPAALLSERMDETFDAWLDYLEAERLADDVRLGVLGYGVGGAVALRLTAVHAERVAAAAIFYGGRPEAAEAHHMAGCFSAVVYLGQAARDPVAATAPLEAALRKAGVDFEAETYPGGRGFAAPDRPEYDPELARRHWSKVTELFERALKRRPPQAADEALVVATN